MSNHVTIEINDNGPFLVKGLEHLKNSRGETVPVTGDTIALCRCGHSGNKPFCDGTHSTAGFTGARDIDKPLETERSYEGEKIAIHDKRTICSHAQYCVHGLPSVFDVEKRPWIDPNGAEPEAIAETIHRCPSGALAYTIDGVRHEGQDRSPSITISRNGPYEVVGDIALKSDLQPPVAEHYALCRCGASRNKPFCDGTHLSNGFTDQEN